LRVHTKNFILGEVEERGIKARDILSQKIATCSVELETPHQHQSMNEMKTRKGLDVFLVPHHASPVRVWVIMRTLLQLLRRERPYGRSPSEKMSP